MSAKFSEEVRIVNNFREYLIARKATIIQLVSPGAQATLSLTYTSHIDKKQRTVFPDLIAVVDECIIVGEIKPRLSTKDEKKLLDIKLSGDGELKVKALVGRLSGHLASDFKVVKFVLVHGSSKGNACSLHQFIVSDKDVIKIEPIN